MRVTRLLVFILALVCVAILHLLTIIHWQRFSFETKEAYIALNGTVMSSSKSGDAYIERVDKMLVSMPKPHWFLAAVMPSAHRRGYEAARGDSLPWWQLLFSSLYGFGIANVLTLVGSRLFPKLLWHESDRKNVTKENS